MRIEEFDYELPDSLIARHPAPERSGSRLLRVDASAQTIQDDEFVHLPELLEAGDVLVVNDTRVVKARLRGRKHSGGRIELLVERVLDPRRALCLIRASHVPPQGHRISIGPHAVATVQARQGQFFLLEFDREVEVVMRESGELPLPPYLGRGPDADDESRYQTIFAREPGAVAAPTAGLHFDEALRERIVARGVNLERITLHVGAGTFQPVREDDVDHHVMHSEHYHVPEQTVRAIEAAKAAGRNVVAVGTTSLRALEAAAGSGRLLAGAGETSLFIRPGYSFRVVDRLVTNFHLPRSTLLMLVCAFGGVDLLRRAYAHAVASGYRFFSYGDAMLLDRRQGGGGA